MTTINILRFCQSNAVLLMVVTNMLSDNFLTFANILNILIQNAPLAIMASTMTLVIIAGGFDLSVGATFTVDAVCSEWIALNIHSFWAAIATSLICKGVTMAISDSRLPPL